MSMNLLQDPLFSVRTGQTTRAASLPETLALLAERGEPLDFPQIRPHQKISWHTTLCQIAAIAMIQVRATDFLTEAEDWRAAIEAVAGTQPWELVENDWTKPAFLQPPITADTNPKKYEYSTASPDELEITVGAKRIDLKDGQDHRPTPERWIYALISHQTTSGYYGPKLYHVSRMNKGMGNRHQFSLAPQAANGAANWHEHIVRDASILANTHQEMSLADILLWTIPWDGEGQLSIEPLLRQPLYIEVARRLRMIQHPDHKLSALTATSKGTRIDLAATRGAVNDPWTLTAPQENGRKAVTVSTAGFDYRQLSNYLDPEVHTLPQLAMVHPTDTGPMTLVARALVRGQGKTEGYHEAVIPFAEKVTELFASPDGQKHLAQAVRIRVDEAGLIARALAHAVLTLMRNGDAQKKGKPSKHEGEIQRKYRAHFHKAVNADFWSMLSDELEADHDRGLQQTYHTAWVVETVRRVTTILRLAEDARLYRASHRYYAIDQARAILWNRTVNNRNLKHHFALPAQETNDEQASEDSDHDDDNDNDPTGDATSNATG